MVIYPCQKYLPQINGFISRLLYLFHWSLCLSLCQYHIVFDYSGFALYFEIGKYESLQLCSSIFKIFGLGYLACLVSEKSWYNSIFVPVKVKSSPRRAPLPASFKTFFLVSLWLWAGNFTSACQFFSAAFKCDLDGWKGWRWVFPFLHVG